MIDNLKNYKDLKNAPGYAGSLRYYLAKKKLDVLFSSSRLCLLNGSIPISKWSNSSFKKLKPENLKPQSTYLFTKITQSSFFTSPSPDQ